PELLAYRERADAPPNSPGWRVRVVPNRFPALRVDGTLERRGEGLYDLMNGIGADEVLVESADHHAKLADLAPAAVEDVVRAIRGPLSVRDLAPPAPPRRRLRTHDRRGAAGPRSRPARGAAPSRPRDRRSVVQAGRPQRAVPRGRESLLSLARRDHAGAAACRERLGGRPALEPRPARGRRALPSRHARVMRVVMLASEAHPLARAEERRVG